MASKHKDRDARIVKLREQGLTVPQLAARFNVSARVIVVVCARYRKVLEPA